MRGRAWRRWKQETIVKKRLRTKCNYYYWRILTVNNSKTLTPTLMDLLARKEHFNSKTLTTDKYTTKLKNKFSPNRGKSGNWSRDGNKNTREWNRKELKKILIEYGIV
jgi:hypothetical protein